MLSTVWKLSDHKVVENTNINIFDLPSVSMDEVTSTLAATEYLHPVMDMLCALQDKTSFQNINDTNNNTTMFCSPPIPSQLSSRLLSR